MTSSGETSPTGTPLSGTPKFGTLIPNRIFVGGIPANTQENELKMFFSNYGAVKDCKIIADRAGVSKGYGFVTFETQEDADKVIKKEADNLIFKDRKLNIGPAIRKQQAFPRIEPSPGAVYFTNGTYTPYSFQNGMAVFHEYGGMGGMGPVAAAQPQQAAAYPMQLAAAQQTAAMYAAIPQNYAAVQTSPPAATPASWATAAAAANQFRWAPQSPGAAAMGSYMYPVQPEMLAYTQPGAHAALYSNYATEMSEAEASAAAAAEGSMALEPNMARPQYVSESRQQQVTSPVYHQQQQQQPHLVSTQKIGPIVYGKRPGSALMSPPTKIFGTQSGVPYSPMATPVNIKGVPRVITRTVNGTSINVLIKDNKMRPIDVLCSPLTPPPTPEVKFSL